MTSLRIALVCDFDGTLAPGSIQEHSFLPSLDIVPAALWDLVKREKQTDDADEILVDLRLLLEQAAERDVPGTRDALRAHGAVTPLGRSRRLRSARAPRKTSTKGVG
jgi:hypothetical protein